MKKYRDHYFLRAKQENYPARSVYKLQEIDKRFELLRRGMTVLDLGAAPGSWTLFTAQRVGPAGRVIAVDLQAMEIALPENVEFFQDDVFEPGPALAERLRDASPLHLVISDMAPKTTGVKITDQSRSLALAEEALALAGTCLLQGGGLVIKIFMGPDASSLLAAMRAQFTTVKTFKPQSSRAESKETFYIGLGFKKPQDP